MEKVTVKLDYPITLNGVECDTFTMRRPKVRDMRGAQKLSLIHISEPTRL